MTSAQVVLHPLFNTHLGFERLFDQMERTLNSQVKQQNYPPHNIIRNDDGYTIEIALAGFTRDHLFIEHDRRRGVLLVCSKSTSDTEPDKRDYVTKGIGVRDFHRSWTLADDMQVDSAEFENGILTIKLLQVVREADKPLLIDIK